MRHAITLLVVSGLVLSLPSEAPAAPRTARAAGRTVRLMRPAKRHFIGGGKVTREYVDRYLIDGRRTATLKHTRGHVKAEVTYKPYGKQNKTRVTKRLWIGAFPFEPTPTEVAKFTFINAMEAVEFGHLKTPPKAELYNAALRGMLERVGPYTRYVPPSQVKQQEAMAENNFAGVGVVMGIRVHKRSGAFSVRFDRVPRHGPAYRAGIRRGDKLVGIDGKPLRDLMKDTDRLAGPEGSKVKLRVERDGKRQTYAVVRAHVDFNRVRTRLTKDGIATIKLPEFDLTADTRIAKALERLEARNRKENGKAELKGLVLDLRNDPGGYVFQAALPILNRFVGKETTLISQRGPTGDAKHKADPAKATHPDLPLTVLVNRRTASASEIVSGALQDLGRAVIIGETTKGKGWMQTELPLPDKGKLILTTDAYHLPSGRSIHKIGVTPDVTMAQAKANFKRARGDKRKVIDYAHEEALSQLRNARPRR